MLSHWVGEQICFIAWVGPQSGLHSQYGPLDENSNQAKMPTKLPGQTAHGARPVDGQSHWLGSLPRGCCNRNMAHQDSTCPFSPYLSDSQLPSLKESPLIPMRQVPNGRLRK